MFQPKRLRASRFFTGSWRGFAPNTDSVNLSRRPRGFDPRVPVSYAGDSHTVFTAAAPGRNRYRFKRTISDFGLGTGA